VVEMGPESRTKCAQPPAYTYKKVVPDRVPNEVKLPRLYRIFAGRMLNKTLTILTFALLSSVNAHLFINVPASIPGSAVKDPLEASGFNFPCHGADFSSPTIRTLMAVGDTQPLGFELGNGATLPLRRG
jgi:hypothetical protein